MIKEIEVILKEFRPCFSRKASFNWFIIVVFGLIVRNDHNGVSSFIRCFLLEPTSYESLLHFFKANSWDLNLITKYWLDTIRKLCVPVKINGLSMYVGDHIKINKSAKKMTGVKKMKQQSDNYNKPDYIKGHNFGVISMLIGTVNLFAIPICAHLQEGVKKIREFQKKDIPEVEGQKKTTLHTLIVQQMLDIIKITREPSLLVLDAFFAVADPFKMARECVINGQRMLHLIIKAKKNYVGYIVDKCGELKRVKLKKVFESKTDEFKTKKLYIYGKKTEIAYYTMNLFWKPINDMLRFVWVKDGDNNFIIMCSDLQMPAIEIIKAYEYRFKIEVSFKFLKHLIGAFKYHFWSKSLPKLKSKVSSIDLEKITDKKSQKLIAKSATAIERFVNLGCIALGILQILSTKFPQKIWKQYSGWLRTKSSNIPSVETGQNVIKSTYYNTPEDVSNSLIFEIIKSKQRDKQNFYYQEDAV